MTIEEELRRAIEAHVGKVTAGADEWPEVEAGGVRARHRARVRRRVVPLLAVAAVIAATATTYALVHDSPSKDRVAVTSTSEVPVTVPPTVVSPATTGPTTSSPTTSSPTTVAATTSTVPSSSLGSAYAPMWPFRTQQEADAWRVANQSGGHEPWHLDAGQTALSFTQGYLGFTDISTVNRVTIDATGAHVDIGIPTTPGHATSAAVIHEVRFGSGAGAPWEVVGTDDTQFSLNAPAYGATVTSPVTVGGHITGVDENISVRVLEPSAPTQLGLACCVPIGNVDTPWTLSVSYAGATDPVLTVVAVTGGHLAQFERFTVTAVRTFRLPSYPAG